MRHAKKTFKLDRKIGPRKALIKTFADQLILFEKVVTTEARAKKIRPYIEKLITKSKNPTLANVRILTARLKTKNAVNKLVTEIGKKYQNKNGGYTRIIKLGIRKGDAGSTVRLELV